MELNTVIRALKIKMKQIKKNRRGIVKAYVSLFLVMLLALVTTYAWFTAKEDVRIHTQAFQMSGSDNIHDSQFQTLQTEIIIPSFNLEEASSVDGRNIYFPASFNNNVSDNNDSNINDSIYIRNFISFKTT